MKFIKIWATCNIQNKAGQFLGRNLKTLFEFVSGFVKEEMVKQSS